VARTTQGRREAETPRQGRFARGSTGKTHAPRRFARGCRAARADTALRTRFDATHRRFTARSPPPARAGRRSEADAGNSRSASRGPRKVVRQERARLDGCGGGPGKLARHKEGAKRRARSQTSDLRSAWSGRSRRRGGSRKAPPWPSFLWRDQGGARSSRDADGGNDARSCRRRTTARCNRPRTRCPARPRHPGYRRRALAER
jgi:hypothetical protein